MTEDDLKCNDCGAVFLCEVVEEGSEGSVPQYCPFCGGTDIIVDDEDFEDDEDYDDD